MQALLRSMFPILQQATANPRLHRRLLGKAGSVSCGLTAPFAWVLVHRSFWLGPPRVCSPGLCKFWRLFGGVNGNLLQEGLCHTQVYFYLLEWIKIQKYDNALFARLCGQSNLSWVAGGRVQCPQRLNCQYLSKLDMQLFSGSGNTPYEST